jgi:hypothetical protein
VNQAAAEQAGPAVEYVNRLTSHKRQLYTDAKAELRPEPQNPFAQLFGFR